MRAIPERLRGVLTTRRYIKPRLPLPLPLPGPVPPVVLGFNHVAGSAEQFCTLMNSSACQLVN